MNDVPITASLEVGKVIIHYTKGKDFTGFTYTTPEHWGGKRLVAWKKRHKKDIDTAEQLLWQEINKK